MQRSAKSYAAIEFKPQGTFKPVTDYRYGVPHDLAPGEWTDDTSVRTAGADERAKRAFERRSAESRRQAQKIDDIASAFARLRRKTKIKKPPKLLRKTSASLLKSNKEFAGIEVLFLGHAPDTIADRHYAQAPQQTLDEAIAWLGQQYGVV